MSYLVFVRRSDGRPILRHEISALVENDASLPDVSGNDAERDGATCEVEWLVGPGKEPLLCKLQSGELEATAPSHAALRKLQEIACGLDAHVIGEGGEDLTSVAVPTWEPSPVLGVSGCAVVVLAIATFLWWLAR